MYLDAVEGNPQLMRCGRFIHWTGIHKYRFQWFWCFVRMIPLSINNAVRRNSVYSFCSVHSTVSPRTRAITNNIFPLTLSALVPFSRWFRFCFVAFVPVHIDIYHGSMWNIHGKTHKHFSLFVVRKHYHRVFSSCQMRAHTHTHTDRFTHSRWIFRRILFANNNKIFCEQTYVFTGRFLLMKLIGVILLCFSCARPLSISLHTYANVTRLYTTNKVRGVNVHLVDSLELSDSLQCKQMGLNYFHCALSLLPYEMRVVSSRWRHIYRCSSALFPNQSNAPNKSRRTRLNMWPAMSLRRWLVHHRCIEIHNRFACISLTPQAGSRHNLVIFNQTTDQQQNNVHFYCISVIRLQNKRSKTSFLFVLVVEKSIFIQCGLTSKQSQSEQMRIPRRPEANERKCVWNVSQFQHVDAQNTTDTYNKCNKALTVTANLSVFWRFFF